MSDTDTSTEQWDKFVNDPAAAESTTATAVAEPAASAPLAAYAAAKAHNQPPVPAGVALLIGRLPIKCAGRAIVELPEPVATVHCGAAYATFHSPRDCERPGRKSWPKILPAEPLNDRQIEVILDEDGDGVEKGLGWKLSGNFPGAQLKSRSVAIGVPHVTVFLWIGLDCGCDDENWASDNPGWS